MFFWTTLTIFYEILWHFVNFFQWFHFFFMTGNIFVTLKKIKWDFNSFTIISVIFITIFHVFVFFWTSLTTIQQICGHFKTTLIYICDFDYFKIISTSFITILHVFVLFSTTLKKIQQILWHLVIFLSNFITFFTIETFFQS